MNVANQVFAWIGGAIVVLLAIGTAIALIRGAYTKARVEALAGDNKELREKINDLRGVVSDLENQHARDDIEKQALSERVSHVENENGLLKQLVTQRADVESVKKILNDHHNAAMKGQDKIDRKQDAILIEVKRLKNP